MTLRKGNNSDTQKKAITMTLLIREFLLFLTTQLVPKFHYCTKVRTSALPREFFVTELNKSVVSSRKLDSVSQHHQKDCSV